MLFSTSTAEGPDGVPAVLLKKCKRSLAEGLEILFKKFLKDGNIPHIMKLAFVIYVHKGGSRGEPANFRPVSITSHIMKTLERLVRESIVLRSMEKSILTSMVSEEIGVAYLNSLNIMTEF